MDVPRPRPPHLHRETTRHGKVVWYVRVGRGARIRIKAVHGTPEFDNEYNAAVRGDRPAKTSAKSGSLRWLWDRYHESDAWTHLSRETRRQRESIMAKVLATAGHEPISRITRKAVMAGIDRRQGNAKRHYLQVLRGLFVWAASADLAQNPTDGLKVKRKQTDGFAVWPGEWCAAYEATWPTGTRERVWYEVIYCTGLRRGDAVRVGRPHVKNRRGMIRAEKNGETAYFIVTDRLQAALDAGPTGELTWIAGPTGKPLTKETFGNYFREACREADVPGSAHGIRKTRATIEAESGASGARLDALFGWKTGSNTSAIYIRKANRARLAFGADEQNADGYSRTLGTAART